MRGAYLPDWLYGFVPPSWWPSQPRDFFGYTLNILPIAASGTVTRSVVFSKRLHSLVFGGIAFVTTTADDAIVQPAGGTPPDKLVTLASPAGQEVFSSGPVPIENLFGGFGYGTGAGPRAYQGHQAGFWPIPIPVQRGGDLQVIVVNLNTAQAHNVRITFYVAVLAATRRKAA
jgi:hypothetical protein